MPTAVDIPATDSLRAPHAEDGTQLATAAAAEATTATTASPPTAETAPTTAPGLGDPLPPVQLGAAEPPDGFTEREKQVWLSILGTLRTQFDLRKAEGR